MDTLNSVVSQPLSRGPPPGTFPPIVQDQPTPRGGFSLDQAGLTDCFILIPSGNPSTALLASLPMLSAALALKAWMRFTNATPVFRLLDWPRPRQEKSLNNPPLPAPFLLNCLSQRQFCTKDSFVPPQAQEQPFGSLVATHPLTNWILD